LTGLIDRRLVALSLQASRYLLEVSGCSIRAIGLICDAGGSVIFVNKNENENGDKRENNEFVNEN